MTTDCLVVSTVSRAEKNLVDILVMCPWLPYRYSLTFFFFPHVSIFLFELLSDHSSDQRLFQGQDNQELISVFDY